MVRESSGRDVERWPSLLGCSERDARRPAAEVLARIPWDGRRVDPTRMSAEQFLGTLLG